MLNRLPSSLEHCKVEPLAVLSSLKHHAKNKAEDYAVTCSGGDLTYGEIARRLADFRHALAERGIGEGAVVAVSIARTVDLIPLLLAIWSLRAAYVPVDPEYPADRQKYILNDAQVSLLVHQGAAHAHVEFADIAVDIDQLGPIRGQVTADYNDFVSPSDTAYIIYTSGSTGDPKGVAVSHANVSNFLQSMQRQPGLTSADRLLAVTTISFDIHVLELFLPILVGACVVLASRDEARSAPALRALMKRHVCTALQATPSTWRMLLDNNWVPPVPIKGLVGGEALPSDLLPQMHRATSQLWNMYGPTETTVWSTCQLIEPGEADILIGSAIANTRLYVVDKQLQPVADGVAGELLIGGEGVTLGYHNKPQLTAQKFLTLPELDSGRLYRTGDLVVRQSCGALKYINRLDGQIKLRGYRIEPGDIETRMQLMPEVTQAVVVRADLHAGNECLVCCYLGLDSDAVALKRFAADGLPSFMVPQYFLHFDDFPKTDNLKINRRALIDVAKTRIAAKPATSQADARDNLDRCVIRVWQNILNTPVVGIDDDFFALGGHSLLALRAVEVMSKATGIDFAPDVIFTSPTIRQILDNPEHGSRQEVTVTKLNGTDSGTPIYCLCGMRIYNELAQQFEGKNPVYCVFGKQEIAMLSQSRDDENLAVFDSQKFLQAYVKAILRQHQGESLILAGFSFGGVLAVEVAQQLESMGVSVETVAMIDSYMPSAFQRSLPALIQDLGLELRRKGLLQRFKSSLVRILNKAGWADVVPTDGDSEKEREEVFDFAADRFEKSIHQYNGRIFLVRATQVDFGLGMRSPRDFGWRRYLTGDMVINDYDTDHTGLMNGAGIVRLCHDLTTYLQSTQK